MQLRQIYFRISRIGLSGNTLLLRTFNLGLNESMSVFKESSKLLAAAEKDPKRENFGPPFVNVILTVDPSEEAEQLPKTQNDTNRKK